MTISRWDCGFALLLLFVVGTSRAANAETRITHDGRFSTHCHAWASDTDVEICRPSIYRLLARPEQYDKKLIAITGFLVRMNGNFLLFPSADRVATGSHEDAIELLDGSSMAEDALSIARKTKRYRNGAPVVVTWTFDAWFSGTGVGRAGGIRDIKNIIVPFVIESDPAN